MAMGHIGLQRIDIRHLQHDQSTLTAVQPLQLQTAMIKDTVG
jgi:hypothetical protein